MEPREILRRMLHRDLRAMAREVELCPDDAALWSRPPGVGNAVGNLALHVAGNLQHFLGAVLGGSGYRRDRDGEFSRRSGTRAEVQAELARAEAAVEVVLPGLDAAALAAPYPAAPGGVRVSTLACLLQLAAHLAFHLGQAGMVRRTLTGSSASSGALGWAELQD